MEDNLDNSFREANSTADPKSSPVKLDKYAPQLTEQNSRFEASFLRLISQVVMLTIWYMQAEMDQMRKRLNEVEMKHARVVHDVSPS